MKKLLAVIMSLVMLFSLAAMPVSAAEQQEEITVQDVVDTLVLTVELIEDTLIQVHFIVGTILAFLEEECPFCGEIHAVESADAVKPDAEAPEADEAPDVEEAPAEESLAA